MRCIPVAPLVALAFGLPASAAERIKLPANMQGDWCWREGDDVYRRGDCGDKAEDWLRVEADGYQGHEFGCKIVRGKIDRSSARYAYMLRVRCRSGDQTWTEGVTMFRTYGDALAVELERRKR